jgi:hypothetical protein
VEKVKSAVSSGTSKLSFGASKITKITGVFGRHRDNNDLQRLSNVEAQRQEELNMTRNESTISRMEIILHGASLFFTFLAICLTAAVAAFQAKWVKVCE